MIWGADAGLIVASLLFTVGLMAMLFKSNLLDFVKANLGLFILVFLFMILLAMSFHSFHEASQNPLSKDFLAWLEQKAGEVLASIMTLVVGAKSANNRQSDKVGGDGSDSSSSTTTTSTSTKSTSTGLGTATGIPH
jgi:high-affinity Fe2+/Pb2+ permease